MLYLVVDLAVNVAAFAVLAGGDADPRVAWAIVALVAALNVVGFLSAVEADQTRWEKRG